MKRLKWRACAIACLCLCVCTAYDAILIPPAQAMDTVTVSCCSGGGGGSLSGGTLGSTGGMTAYERNLEKLANKMDVQAAPKARAQCVQAALQQALQNPGASAQSYPATYNSSNPNTWVPNRDANPIDMKYDAYAKSLGATKSDGGFAVFPNVATGLNAALASLNSFASSPKNLTVSDLIQTWAPPSDGNPNALANTLKGVTGFSASTPLSSLNTTQKMALLAAFARQEGFMASQCS